MTKVAQSELSPITQVLLNTRHDQHRADDCFYNEFFNALLTDPRFGGVQGVVEFGAETHALAAQSKSLPLRSNWLKTLIALAGDCERVRREREDNASEEELYQRMVAAMLSEVQKNPAFAVAMIVSAVKSLHTAQHFIAIMDQLIQIMESAKRGDFALADSILSVAPTVSATPPEPDHGDGPIP